MLDAEFRSKHIKEKKGKKPGAMKKKNPHYLLLRQTVPINNEYCIRLCEYFYKRLHKL